MAMSLLRSVLRRDLIRTTIVSSPTTTIHDFCAITTTYSSSITKIGFSSNFNSNYGRSFYTIRELGRIITRIPSDLRRFLSKDKRRDLYKIASYKNRLLDQKVFDFLHWDYRSTHKLKPAIYLPQPPVDFPFKIHDNPDEDNIKLTRKLVRDNIEIEVFCQVDVSTDSQDSSFFRNCLPAQYNDYKDFRHLRMGISVGEMGSDMPAFDGTVICFVLAGNSVEFSHGMDSDAKKYWQELASIRKSTLINQAEDEENQETQEEELTMTNNESLVLLLPPDNNNNNNSFPSSLLIYLYVGHFLARWGARMWEFSVALYMINVYPDSLLLAATYGVVESASIAIFGPFIGHLVDKLSYIQVLRLWLLSQNMSFMIAGCSVVAVLVYTNFMLANYTVFVVVVILINISGAVGVLSTLGGTILVEREWVVVISEGQPEGVLTKMNSTIRRIDLICKLCAPVVSGFIISFVSLTASAVTLALWNLLSVCLQYWLLMSVYNGIPALKEVSQRRLSKSSRNEGKTSTLNDLEQPESSLKETNTIVQRFLNLQYIKAWRLYLQQDVVLPGLALALLFFTVLSFGTLMTAALEWKGIPAYVIGIARGVAATIGIAATFLYPILESRISTLRTGLWSIWSQWSCLLLCVGSVFIKDKLLAAYTLMGGVAISRLGLWMFDLSVIQQMQDHVPESDRCVVGGVQNSLQSVMDLMTYIMGIIISNPEDFWKLTMLSFLLVTLAAALYSLYIFRVRKHLFHFEKLLLVLWPTRST